MGFESLINTIKNSIQVNTSTDISMTEHSCLMDLFHKSEEEDQPRADDFKFCRKVHTDFAGSRFPIGSFVCSLLKWALFGLLWLFYAICGWVVYIITGKKRNMQHSARLNAVLLLTAIVFFICALSSLFVLFTHEVLFYDNKNEINTQGAVEIKMSCEREHYFFLLNCATRWANSGIEVMKGDEVQITISGGFHDDLRGLVLAARQNTIPMYRWNFDNELLPATPLCIYHGKDAKFSSLLYQIQPETKIRDKEALSLQTENIRQYNKEQSTFVAEESGYLLFCVNDQFCTDSTDVWNQLQFQDNLGEQLINVAVTRGYQSPATHLPHISFRKVEGLYDRGQLFSTLGKLSLVALLLGLLDWSVGVWLRRRK